MLRHYSHYKPHKNKKIVLLSIISDDRMVLDGFNDGDSMCQTEKTSEDNVPTKPAANTADLQKFMAAMANAFPASERLTREVTEPFVCSFQLIID